MTATEKIVVIRLDHKRRGACHPIQGHLKKHQVPREAEGGGRRLARGSTVVSMGRKGEAG